MQSRGLDRVWFLCPWRDRKVVKPLKPNRQQQRTPTLHRLKHQLRKVFIGGEEIDTHSTQTEKQTPCKAEGDPRSQQTQSLLRVSKSSEESS